jgi:hypothetical protein
VLRFIKTPGSLAAIFIATFLFLPGIPCSASLPESKADGWSRQEAEAKLNLRVECIRNPDQKLLKWGPNFTGWERSRQPKALGQPVQVGARGYIKEILKTSEGKYRVAVHWDPEKAGAPFWITVIGPDDFHTTVSPLAQSDLLGAWREIGKAATLEFFQDGTLKAVDNEGLEVVGKYTVSNEGTITCGIQVEGTTEEKVNAKFSITGDRLTLTPADGSEPERYRRTK